MHKHKNPITNTNREIAQTNDLAIGKTRKRTISPQEKPFARKKLKKKFLQLSYRRNQHNRGNRLDHTMLP